MKLTINNFDLIPESLYGDFWQMLRFFKKEIERNPRPIPSHKHNFSLSKEGVEILFEYTLYRSIIIRVSKS